MSLNLAIITADKNISDFYSDELKYLFGNVLNITNYCTEDNSAFLKKTEDIFLVTNMAFDSYDQVIKSIPKNKPIIFGSVTVKNKNIEILRNFPNGTKALLVNTTLKMSLETILTLYQKGINNIEFYPYFPGCDEKYYDIDIAVTPSEQRFVPKNIKKIIDIENRVFNTKTIIEIAIITECEYLLNTEKFKNYFKKISENNFGIENLIEKTNKIREQFNTIVQNLDIGIITIDSKNIIFSFNKKAIEFLCINNKNILYKNILEILPNDFFKNIEKNTPIIMSYKNKIGKNFKIMITPIINNNIYEFSVILITREESSKIIEDELAQKIIRKGHKARYTFDDIIGKSSSILSVKEIAKKMAKTELTVLITGESGTGKELFAHAIHNLSERKNKPFVAINCAAISDNLLESEFFGYEEGAFTGAKKGGKIGLFEIANSGTIFLDEIEGMSQNLQIKLLRVIQEKEIMKVGGDKLIPIDVRIIAASNENLPLLVEKKLFREDLYYRINILPITIPPLRDRKEDLFSLIEIFKNNIGSNFSMSQETIDLLKIYKWPGNIRELRNCIEYLSCLEEKNIEVHMLPNYISNNTNYCYKKDLKKEIAKIINSYEIEGDTCGRERILYSLKQNNPEITEAKVKKILLEMKKKKLIVSSKGRGGTKLTEIGKINYINKF